MIFTIIMSMVFQIGFPIVSYALTSGPSAPEFNSFEPVGTSELVDVATGDFVYNIPLLDVEGYPINVAYHSGISMDQEASCVGLGWNINPGVINRSMRGLPDDFQGDSVTQRFDMKPNQTLGVSAGLSWESFGADWASLNVGLGIYHNNYKGLGYEINISPSTNIGALVALKNTSFLGPQFGISYNSQAGIGLMPSLSFAPEGFAAIGGIGLGDAKIGVSTNYNSRQGLKGFSFFSQLLVGAPLQTYSPMLRTSNQAFISFAQPTYTPRISMPFVSSALDISFGFGSEFLWQDSHMNLSAYYSEQRLLTEKLSKAAFGYLYSDKVPNNAIDVLLDFNRENDNSFIKGATKYLAIPAFTHDIYSASGQGFMGQFRPYRSDLGMVHDDQMNNVSASGDLGVQVGAGGFFDAGGHVSLITSRSHSQAWLDGNQIWSKAGFKGYGNADDPLYEPYYFKQVGELTTEDDPGFYSQVGGSKVVRVELGDEKANPKAKNRFVYKNGSSFNGPNSYTRTKRASRNNLFRQLTAAEATEYGLTSQIQLYDLDNPYNPNGELKVNAVSRESGGKQGHHLSEIEAINPSGQRYVYGIPVYNGQSKDVSFNVEGLSQGATCDYGLVKYEHGVDNNVGNERGRDHFFHETTQPPYAYAYLLTAVLSPDYVDSDGVEGPSDEDLGSWHKINYARVSEDYGWRTPFQDPGSSTHGYANLSKGFLSRTDDDKASYSYGTKEMYYVHSIESRHYIAEFTYGDRDDGYGVENEQGEIATYNPLKKLTKITLYSKAERKADIVNSTSNAVPIKTVHLRYDYTLCQGVHNNSTGKGKLTLRKLWFTHGRSQEASLNPYSFIYGDPDHDNYNYLSPGDSAHKVLPDSEFNPDYDPKAYDRWGTYKPNSVDPCTDGLDNSNYPYTSQGTLDASDPLNPNGISGFRETDAYVQAWHLSTILTPSGGSVEVDYESDDYAYVQHKQATEMFDILGFGTTNIYGSSTHLLYSGNFPSDPSYVFVRLRESISSQTFQDEYLSGFVGDNWMYLNVLVNLNRNKSGFPEKFERIPVYTKIDISQSGIVNGPGNIGYIRMEKVPLEDKKSGSLVSPVVKAAMNYLHLKLPDYVYNPSLSGSAKNKFLSMLGFANDMRMLFSGYNKFLEKKKYCQESDLSKSWIRLPSADGMKHGGGIRVSEIRMRDNWDAMVGSSNGSNRMYGQTYDYTMYNADSSRVISSGVAAYEPIIGNDENPFKQPIYFSEELVGVPDINHYIEKPLGESFYPAPQVIYRKVKVSSLKHPDVKRNATGYTQHEFYTAKEYPTHYDATKLDTRFKSPSPILKFLNIGVREMLTGSQGYAIYRNNMHGKPRATRVYAEGKKDPISEVEYHYRTVDGFQESKVNRLDNQGIPVLNKDGTIAYKTIGEEIELILDGREEETFVGGMNLSANVNVALIPLLFIPLPIPIPSVWPTPITSKTRFRSIVATKVIDTYGVLEKTIVTDRGSSVATENVTWDVETGQVLLTKTTNEFADPLYSFSYPAHWAYEGMDQGANNQFAYFLEDIDFSNVSSDIANILTPGDELWLRDTSSNSKLKGWVLDIDDSGSPIKVSVIQKNGNLIPATTYTYVRVIRSGHRNQAGASIGSVASKENPVASGTLSFADSSVLSAGAVQYSDDKKLYGQVLYPDSFCYPLYPYYSDTSEVVSPGEIVNPYVQGIKGNWYPLKSFTYLTNRTYDQNIREDGVLVDFSPFWQPGLPYASYSTIDWTWADKVTKHSPYGYSLENTNPLDIYSSALYAYRHQVPIAVAGNARYNEIGNLNFESSFLDSLDSSPPHLQLQVYEYSSSSTVYRPIHEYLSTDLAHSGEYSLKLKKGSRWNWLYLSHQFRAETIPSGQPMIPHITGEESYAHVFSPTQVPGGPTQYLISFWALDSTKFASENSLNPNNYLDIEASLITECDYVGIDSIIYGSIIDGWQKIDVLVDLVDVNNTQSGDPFNFRIMFSPKIENPGDFLYLDDFRIHPFNSTMKTYVYRARDLRLMAEGDENNYMRFYKYNAKGELISVQVETERGIFTVQEARYNSSKANNP